MSVIIKSVDVGSPADKSGIKAGELLLTVNGNEIMDVLDYRFYQNENKLKITVADKNGKLIKHTVKKDEFEELGLGFETYLMDKQRSCKNKCIFCFIDQLPKGLRESLYFKDDDSRLSFLFGNYITLTNITEHEIERIIKMHISPVNISVHTTNPELRVKMMKNPHAGESLEVIKRLNDANITMHCQLVLCRGYNDGEELRRSLDELMSYSAVECVAAVPVGLTRYRDGLNELKPFDKESAEAVLDIMEEYADTGRVFPGDEFYLLAERPVPPSSFYGDFYQLENGVGLWAMVRDDANDALKDALSPKNTVNVSIATGVAAYPLITDIVNKAKDKLGNINCNVYAIENDFFGHSITVAGLVTGGDIINQLKGKPLGDCLIIPDVMLRHEKDMFLDDVTVDRLSKELNVPVKVVPAGGYELIETLCNLGKEDEDA